MNRLSLWLLVFISIGSRNLPGQSLREKLENNPPFKIEWIQQKFVHQEAAQAKPYPLYPDQLKTGEYDVRIGFQVIEHQEIWEAKIDYISLVEFPSPNSQQNQDTSAKFIPKIFDTRYQDTYFYPELYLLDELVGRSLPISCEESIFDNFLADFYQEVREGSPDNNLTDGQVEWLQEITLPETFSASSLSSFFCALQGQTLPTNESPYALQSCEQDDQLLIDFIRLDEPSKRTLLHGKIQSPATNQVRITYFKQGNWLKYWQDTVLHLDDNNSFTLAFPLDNRRTVTLYHGLHMMVYSLHPGDSLSFQTNANAFYREMNFSGQSKRDNEFLLDFYHEMRGDSLSKSYDHLLIQKDHQQYFEKLFARESAELFFLQEHAHALSIDFLLHMDRKIRLDHASTKWEAAYRFAKEKGVKLEPTLIADLKHSGNLLYRLPIDRTFDFKVEDYLAFLYHQLQDIYQNADISSAEEMALGAMLPSKETFVRHTAMQLFRSFGYWGRLSESSLDRLSIISAIARDTNLRKEWTVFRKIVPRDTTMPFHYRVLHPGQPAPHWTFTDNEGVEIGLKDFVGKKVLLHIGWAKNLEMALVDLEEFKSGQSNSNLPEIIHLVAAPSKEDFNKKTAGEKGLFIYLRKEELDILKEKYYIDNSSNQYFLIGEDGTLLASNLTLATSKKLRGTWAKLSKVPSSFRWTPAQRLRFWQSIGIGTFILLMISGVILWRRRISMRRDQRRRQLLEVELRGIRSQMNPHFLFNAMSSIQNLIRKQEQEKADIYLGQFAGLMRKTLRNTAEEYIPLSDEIDTLEQYCSLESLRHPFEYSFHIHEEIDSHNTYIPSMILQPIIENAILHGLTPLAGSRELRVNISLSDLGLHCKVIDNGIGLLEAQAQVKDKAHKSFGTKLVRQRLDLLGLDGEKHFNIQDRSQLSPASRGTLVTLTIPVEQ